MAANTAEIPNRIKKIPTTQVIIWGLTNTIIPAIMASIPPIIPLIAGISLESSFHIDCGNYIGVNYPSQVPRGCI